MFGINISCYVIGIQVPVYYKRIRIGKLFTMRFRLGVQGIVDWDRKFSRYLQI